MGEKSEASTFTRGAVGVCAVVAALAAQSAFAGTAERVAAGALAAAVALVAGFGLARLADR